MWIPLSKMCLCGIVANPTMRGIWAWKVGETQWQFQQHTGLIIQVWHGNEWLTVGKGETLNHAVAFSLGWEARCDLD